MKIFYLNDEIVEVTVRTIDSKGDNTYTKLLPGQSRTFEFDAPATAIPYVKRWETRTVLLSYINIVEDKSAQ